jgi:hypothetical protein
MPLPPRYGLSARSVPTDASFALTRGFGLPLQRLTRRQPWGY